METDPKVIQSYVEKVRKEVVENQELIKNDTEKFNELMKEKYSDFVEHYPTIYRKIVEGTLDPDKFEYMMDMLTNVKGNNISQHDASVKVGQKLVDHYVKPELEKK